MNDSPSDKKGFIFRDLQWGVLNDEAQLKAFPSIKAFCEIDSETFATSDGRYVTIWSPKMTIATINLRAIALHYIHRVNHIVAFVQKSIELFFISMRSPYTVTKNPFPFSNKVITVIHFFEKSSILVTAGQGLMFTKIVIPSIFKTSSPIPEMLKFEKVAEIYQDQLFVNHHSPVFVDSKEVVIVYFETAVKFHLLDGTCIQQFDHFTMSPISCINFYDEKNTLIAGDQEGHISVIALQCKHPFQHGAHPETGAMINTYRPEVCHLLYTQIFERDFLVSIGLNRQITVFSLVSEKIIQQVRINSIYPQLVLYFEPRFFIFSEKEIISFTINIFTKHFASLSADSNFLGRCPSLTTAARLLCITTDSIVSLFSPKNAKILFGISAVDYQHDIQNVVYPRDIINDGISVKPLLSALKNDYQDPFKFQTLNQNQNQNQFQALNKKDIIMMNSNLESNKSINFDAIINSKNQNDYGFFRMGNDTLLMIDFNVQKKMLSDKKKPKLFTSITFMDAKYLSSKTFEWSCSSQFVSLLRIETNRYPSSLMGICKSGICHILTINNDENKPVIETFPLGYGSVICAAFSSVHKLVTFSCLYHTIVYDLDNRKILFDIERTYFRSLLIISDRSIACGCANGALEIRNFPHMTIQASSSKYEVYHSNNGYRRDLRQELENYERMMDIDFSITSIDYCSPRNALITFSPNGEIFIWTIDCFPICHILLDFRPTAACFLNGHGTVVISALRTLFTIDWHYFFDERLQSDKTILDDFDILDDKFDLQKFAETRLEHAEELEFLVKQKQTPGHKFKRVLGPENFESLTPSNSRPSSKMNYRPFRIRRNTSIESLDGSQIFEELVVDQEEIPKNYFYRQEEYLAPKPKRRKIQKPVNLTSLPDTSHLSLRPKNSNNGTKNDMNSSDKNKSQTQKVSKPDKSKEAGEIKVKRKNKRECEIENNKISSSTKKMQSSSTAATSNNSKKKKKQANNPTSASVSSKSKVSKNIKVKKVTKSLKNKSNLSNLSNLSARRIKAQSSSNALAQIDNSVIQIPSNEIINDFESRNIDHRLNNTPCQSQNQIRRRKKKQRKEKQGENENEEYEYEDEYEDVDETINRSQIGNENKQLTEIVTNESKFDFEPDEIIIRDDSKRNLNARRNLNSNSIADGETSNVSCQTLTGSGNVITDDPGKFGEDDQQFNNIIPLPLELPPFSDDSSINKKNGSNNNNNNSGGLSKSRSPRLFRRSYVLKSKSKRKIAEKPQEKKVIEIHMKIPGEGTESTDWRLLSGVGKSANKSVSNSSNNYQVKEPNSQYLKHPRNRYNKSIANAGNENDPSYEFVSDEKSMFRSPLLYVQNYGESCYESGDEEHFSEPYVIEDLNDPRMKFSADKKMKYLKMNPME